MQGGEKLVIRGYTANLNILWRVLDMLPGVLYDLSMASITKKRVRGHTYYYARECQRVDGKPRIVWQQYLGKAEHIAAAVQQQRQHPGGPPPPLEQTTIADFGDVAALYDLARRLQLPELIDRHVPKQGQGPSVGTYLLISAINRCSAPTSKASTGEWFDGTVLRRLTEVESRQLTSQRFWDNMDRVGPEAITAIESDLVQHMVKEFDLDIRHLLFDATNFFTFIDTFNERADLAQRGHSKEGRSSLRIVGLAMLVSSDFHIPLLHHTYPGNQADAPTFASLTDALAQRCTELTTDVEHITIVLDKGNNSRENMEAIDASDYNFVGSLVPTQHPDLLEIPRSEFRSLDDQGLPGVTAYRAHKRVFGRSRTVVVTFNDNLFVTQSRTLLREINKRQQRLRDLHARLERRRQGHVRQGRTPTVASVRKKVNEWLRARHMKELFEVEVHDEDGLPKLSYRFNQEAWENLESTLLGKTILFTDNDDWSDAQIVKAYRAQHHVEDTFRVAKDPHHVGLRPQHHWTDQKIRMHVLICVIALMLVSLLQRELHRQGIELSIPRMLERLGKMREVAVAFPPPEGETDPIVRVSLEDLDDQQQAIYDALGLQRYASG